jgi:hypothetical protein
MRHRAIASVAIASLVIGGTGYLVADNASPPAPHPYVAMSAEQWAGRAEAVLASINRQLDALAQTEASWLQLPEQQRAQAPDALRAVHDRKTHLENQRAALQSRLAALRALPHVSNDVAEAQAELDAVERALASTDQPEAARRLEEQREMRRRQLERISRELADLQSEVEQATRSPLPDDSDSTTSVVEQVEAVTEDHPDDKENGDKENGDNKENGDERNGDDAPDADEQDETPPATRLRDKQDETPPATRLRDEQDEEHHVPEPSEPARIRVADPDDTAEPDTAEPDDTDTPSAGDEADKPGPDHSGDASGPVGRLIGGVEDVRGGPDDADAEDSEGNEGKQDKEDNGADRDDGDQDDGLAGGTDAPLGDGDDPAGDDDQDHDERGDDGS